MPHIHKTDKNASISIKIVSTNTKDNSDGSSEPTVKDQCGRNPGTLYDLNIKSRNVFRCLSQNRMFRLGDFESPAYKAAILTEYKRGSMICAGWCGYGKSMMRVDADLKRKWNTSVSQIFGDNLLINVESTFDKSAMKDIRLRSNYFGPDFTFSAALVNPFNKFITTLQLEYLQKVTTNITLGSQLVINKCHFSGREIISPYGIASYSGDSFNVTSIAGFNSLELQFHKEIFKGFEVATEGEIDIHRQEASVRVGLQKNIPLLNSNLRAMVDSEGTVGGKFEIKCPFIPFSKFAIQPRINYPKRDYSLDFGVFIE